MPTKKSEEPSKKTKLKEQQKQIEDKTFGLKNKNKSKSVQKYIKGVTAQVQGPQKASTAQKNDPHAEKEAQKKALQQNALLNSLFKTTKKEKDSTVVPEDEEPEAEIYNPKACREKQKINLYVDQRLEKARKKYEEGTDGWTEKDYQLFEAEFASRSGTMIVCRHFLQSVEKQVYGWMWMCPNGDECKYRHCVDPDYVFDLPEENEEIVPFEEVIDQRKRDLRSDKTWLITEAEFTEWVARRREGAAEPTKDHMSGKSLFAYNPSLFIDDEEAVEEEDYQEDWTEVIAENERAMEESRVSHPLRRESSNSDEKLLAEELEVSGAQPLRPDIFLS